MCTRCRRLRAGLSLLLLAAYLPACTSYRTVDDPVEALQPSPKPVRKARVTVDTGERFEVVSPRVSGDSLQGQLHDGTAVSVSMGEIQALEVRTHDGKKTGWLIVGSVLAAIAAAFGILAISINAGA